MRKVFAIAWREFKHTVLRPIFIIAIIGVPILIVGGLVLATMMMIAHEKPGLEGTVVIVTSDPEVASAARLEFDPDRIVDEETRQMREAAEQAMDQLGGQGLGPGMPSNQTVPIQRGEVRITVETVSPAEGAIDSLRERLRRRDIIAYIVIDEAVLAPPETNVPRRERPRITMAVADELVSDHVRLISKRAGLAVVRVRALRAEYEPEQIRALLEPPGVQTMTITESGLETEENEAVRQVRAQIVPMAFMMLIWIGVFSSAQHLMMSTIEEKSNRVMEVLLSAVSPLQLMTGKILGYGAVGLLIVSLYASLAVAALISLAMSHFISWTDLLYLGVFYLMAYFMIATMMAAVGSAVSDIREANTLITPVMIILFIPLMLWMPISQSPNGLIAVICSFVPPAIPFAMILRVVAEEQVPMWQIVASVVWGFICVGIMVWGASKIFRVGVLMTGKPPSPIELLKWIRYS